MPHPYASAGTQLRVPGARSRAAHRNTRHCVWRRRDGRPFRSSGVPSRNLRLGTKLGQCRLATVGSPARPRAHHDARTCPQVSFSDSVHGSPQYNSLSAARAYRPESEPSRQNRQGSVRTRRPISVTKGSVNQARGPERVRVYKPRKPPPFGARSHQFRESISYLRVIKETPYQLPDLIPGVCQRPGSNVVPRSPPLSFLQHLS